MSCRRNLRKIMFTKLDLLRILSGHHCIILHEKPASFSEQRESTMANQEEAMDTNLLELDPADEEAGKDSVGGHEENITEALVNELLTPAEEPVSMAATLPRKQPPTEASGLHQATPTADKVTSTSATQEDVLRVMAEMDKKEKKHQEEMEEMRASLRKLEEGNRIATVKISILEKAEHDRTSRRQKRTWKRTMSFSSPVRPKSARAESANRAKKTGAEKKREDVFTARRVQFNQGADLQSVRDSFSIAEAKKVADARKISEARKHDGFAPTTPAPSGDQTNGEIWFNWRSSARGNKRMPIVEYKRNLLLGEWLGLDRSILKSMGDLIQSELYCCTVMLMVHAGYIRVPRFLGFSYRHPSHSAEGALERIRWLIPGVVPHLGSNPRETIRQRFLLKGLPHHLEPYSMDAERIATKPKGERMIDHRLQITSSIKTTRLQVTSTGNGNAPDLRAKLSIKTSGSNTIKETEEVVNIMVSSKEPTPAATEDVPDAPEVVPEEEPVKEKVDAANAAYAYKDVRQKQWDKQRRLIIRALESFRRDRASNAGSRELRRYLREKLVNKLARKSLIPEKLRRISDENMEEIISRTSGLTTHALEAFIPLPGASAVDSDSEQSDDESHLDGMDVEDDEDQHDDTLILNVSEDHEFRTPPRKQNNAPRVKRTDSGSTSSSRRGSSESKRKTVMRKPSYQSGHISYSKTKDRTASHKTARPRSRSRSCSPRRSSPRRGSRSSPKKRDHKRRGEGK